MELINFDNVREVLEQYAQEVRNTYQDNLIKNDRIVSGDLLNSVEYNVAFNGVAYEVQLKLRDYWKYLEYGIQGKKNPSSPFSNPGWKAYPFILNWVTVKPVIPRPLSNGKLPTPKQLAFLITRSRAEKGSEPGEELKDAIEAVNAKYKDKLIIALHKDMETLMKVALGEIQGQVPTY